MCGGSKGQSTSKSDSKTSWNPTGLPELQNIYNQANQTSQTPYVPYPGQLVAGFTPEQQWAQNNINMSPGMAFPFIGQSADLFGQSAENPNFNGLTQSFYNPMAQNVMANLNEVFGQQMANTTGQLQQAAGGVGADRIAVGQAELARQQGLAAGQTMAQLYGQAQQAAAGQQGLEQAAGFGFGQLGPAAEQALLTGANAQLGIGTLGQQTQQNLLNANYQQFLRQQGYPFQTTQFLAGIGIPAATGMGGQGTGQSMQTVTPAQPSPISQGLGLGIGLLGMLRRGGPVKLSTGGVGDTPTWQPGVNSLNAAGYVPTSQIPQMPSQFSQAQAAGMGYNSMSGSNPLLSPNPASQTGSPMALAKGYEDMYAQGQKAKGGLHDLVDKATRNGWLSGDEAGDLAQAGFSGWDTTTTAGDDTPTAYRGGRFALGGSPFNGAQWMQQNDTDPSGRPQPDPEQVLAMLQANPTAALGGGSGMARAAEDQIAKQKSAMPTPSLTGQQPAVPSATQGSSPFVPGQQSVDIGDVNDPGQFGMSPIPPMRGGSPMMDGSPTQNGFSPFDPTAGGSLSMVPDWLKKMGGPQAASNAGNGASTQPGVPTGNIQRPPAPTASIATGGAIRRFDGGGGAYDPTDWSSMAGLGLDAIPGGFGAVVGRDFATRGQSSNRFAQYLPQYRDAIAAVESRGSGDYNAINRGSGALGRYQVMPTNLEAWLREANMPQMSPRQFLSDHDAQDKLFDFKFGQYINKYGNPNDAASVWFSGRPVAGNNSHDQWTGLHAHDYVQRFQNALNDQDQGTGNFQPPMRGQNAMSESNMAQTPTMSGTASRPSPFMGATGSAVVGSPNGDSTTSPSPNVTVKTDNTPDYEQAYFQGQIHGTSPFGVATGGSIGRYATDGAVNDDGVSPPLSDWTPDQVAELGARGNHKTTFHADPPPAPTPVTSGTPDAPGAGASLTTSSPYEMKDPNALGLGATAQAAPDSPLVNSGKGGLGLDDPSTYGTPVAGDYQPSQNKEDYQMLPPGEQEAAPGSNLNEYGKEREHFKELERRFEDVTQVPNFLGKPLTPTRAALMEAGFAMMAGTSPFAGVNIGAGLGAGVRGFFGANNQYINQAQEAMKAQSLLQQMYRPVPVNYLSQLQDPGSASVSGDLSDKNNPVYRFIKPEALDLMARQWFNTGTPPTGVSRNPMVTAALWQKLKEVAQEAYPDDPDAQADAIAKARGNTLALNAGQRTAGVQLGRTLAAEKAVENWIQPTLDLSAKVPRTNFPLINEGIMTAMQQSGDANVTQLGQALNHIVNEYVNATTKSGVSTEASKQRAFDILNKYWAPDQLKSGLGLLQAEIKNVENSNWDALDELGKRYGMKSLRELGAGSVQQGGGAAPAGGGGGPPSQYPNAKPGIKGGWWVPDPNNPGRGIQVG